jgi:hypothetical protein
MRRNREGSLGGRINGRRGGVRDGAACSTRSGHRGRRMGQGNATRERCRRRQGVDGLEAKLQAREKGLRRSVGSEMRLPSLCPASVRRNAVHGEGGDVHVQLLVSRGSAAARLRVLGRGMRPGVRGIREPARGHFCLRAVRENDVTGARQGRPLGGRREARLALGKGYGGILMRCTVETNLERVWGVSL